MANVSRINGFRPAKYFSGSPWNGAVTKYFVTAADATAIFVGDLVKIDGTGNADGFRGVTRAAAGDAVCGAVVGFGIDPTNLNTPQYRLSSTTRVVLVADDPNILFETETSNGTLAAADVGQNALHAVGTGSTTTGQSGATLDVGTKGTTATYTLKVIEFVQRVDNEVGNASAKVLVKINNHQLNPATGSAGV